MRNRLLPSALHVLLFCLLTAVTGLTASAQSYYLFDSYLEDDSRLELLDEDGDGWYTGRSTLKSTRFSNPYNFAITTSATPKADSETATFYGPTSDASAPTAVQSGAEFDVVETAYDHVYGDKDCFHIEPVDFKIAEWEVAFNPEQMKVRFNYAYIEVDAPAELYLVDYQTNYGKAVNDGNGVFKFKGVVPNNSRYPYFGFTDTPAPGSATVTVAANNYNPNIPAANVEVELNTVYTWGYGVFASIDAPHDAFIINTTSKKYDITLDWNAKTVVFSDYVPEAPETLWVVNYNVAYGSAERQPGNIYEFRGVELKSVYKDYGFADLDSPTDANFVISAVAAADATAGNRVKPESGVAYPWAFSSQGMLNAEKGTFDLPAGTYDITLDWDNQTVTFKMLPPANLFVIAFGNKFGSAAPDENGVYTYTAVHLDSQFHHYGFATVNPAAGQTPSWVLEPYEYSATAPNVEPVSGTAYPWVFSDYDAVDKYHGAFLIEDGYYNISLDWYAKTVVFTRVQDPAPAKLWVINYNTSYGSAEPDENGVFRFNDVALGSAYKDYGFANNFDPYTASLIISAVAEAEATTANRVTVEYGTPYTWAKTTQEKLDQQKGTFDLPNGNYDIVLDWYAGTVTFTKAAPAKLYFTSYNQSYRVADKAEGNIYIFEDVTPTNATFPYYGISQRANPGQADWVIVPDMTGVETLNLLPELDTPYPVVMVADNVMNSERNSFQVGATVCDVTFDWNNMTVTFSQKAKEMPETLWIGRPSKLFASATAENGVFTFKNVKLSNPSSNAPTYGFFDNETPSEAEIVIGASINTVNYVPQLGVAAPWAYTLPAAISTEKGGFQLAEGEYNVTLDWNSKTVTFSAPDLPEAPERLWLIDDSSNFGSATAVDGVFTFEAVTISGSTYPYFGFANSAVPRNSTLVISAAPSASATAENNIDVELGKDYPVFLSSYQTIYDMKGSFKLADGTYDIVLDYKNASVRFSKPAVKVPDTLYATDNYLDETYGYTPSNGTGVFEFTVDYTAVNHILVFSSSSDLRNSAGSTLYFGSNGAPVNVELGTAYELAPASYSVVWNNNTGFILPVGLYRVTVDFNNATVVFNATDAREIHSVADLAGLGHGDKVTIGRDWAVVHTLGDDLYVYDNATAHADHVGHTIKVTAADGLDEIAAGALLSNIEAEVAVAGNGTKSLIINNCKVTADGHSLRPLDVAVDIQTTKTYGDFDFTEFEYFETMQEHQIVNLRGLGFSFTPDAEGKQFAGLFNSLDVKNGVADPIYIRFEWKGDLSGDFSTNAYNVVGIVGPEYEEPAGAPARAQYIDGKTFSTRKVYALAINPYDGEDGTTAVENVVADPDAPEAWYTIQGIRVETPTPGNTYIRVANGIATKVLVK